jgi:hypothetical protein
MRSVKFKPCGMEIKYQLFEKEGLVIQKYSGIFALDKYAKYSRFIAQNFASKPVKKILIDFRNLKFGDLADVIPDKYASNLEKVTAVREKVNRDELKNKDFVLAIWVDEPIPTLIAHQFVNNFSHMNYNYCSTREEVVKVLMLSDYLEVLENMIDNLENTF